MKHFRWVLFLTLAILAVSAPLYLHEQKEREKQRYEQQLEKNALLLQQIDSMEEIYEERVQELTEAQDENRKVLKRLNKAQKEVEDVKHRNTELESILFNQRETYQNAVAMRGAGMPVMTRSNFTARQYERAWRNLGACGLKGTGEALVQAEESHGVNSLVLSGIAFLESNGGKSRLAREKNNLFGLGAGGPDPYGSALCFSSKNECIRYTAGILRHRYLSRGALLYRGNNLTAIGPNYATDPLWAEKVSQHMSLIARAAIPGGR